jgi:16S rRNA (adenine1518-N6/adenine1519-N6)-dimethyltransferase
LLGPADVRRLAGEIGIRPAKRLGQNFVHDPNTVRRIVTVAGVGPDDVVVEVGPGLGSLTLALLPHVRQVTAIEIDETLANRLPRTVAEFAPGLEGRLVVVADDAMRVGTLPGPSPAAVPGLQPTVLPGPPPTVLPGPRPTVLPGPPPTALVANLPYNVAVPVLLHLLAELPAIRHGLVMVQAEVADRLAAEPGSKTYGVPSVKAAWYASVRRAGAVPRTVFWPVPNVDSGLVAFTRREPPEGADRAATFAVVDAAFAQRRKTLRSALAGWAGSARRAEAILRAAGVDPSARGEQLDVAAFAKIAGHATA